MSPFLLNPYAFGSAGGAANGAHAYWRIVPAGNQVGTGITELAFKDDAGSSISTGGSTAIEAGHVTTNDSSKLFDGNSSTFWEQGNGISANSGWAGIHFTSPQKVRQIGVQFETTANMDGKPQPTALLVECSDDGAVWQVVAHLELGTVPTNTLTWFDFSGCVVANGATDFGSHTYWRFVPWVATGFTALSALRFKDAGGSVIATTGGSAFESAHFSTFDSSMLFDSNDATFWESTSLFDRSWAGYQFSSAQTVMQFGLQRHASMDGSNPPFAFLAEFSDNGTCWGIAALIDVGTLTNDVTTWYDLSAALPVASTTDFGTHAYWRANSWVRAYAAWSAILHKDDSGSFITPSGGTASSSGHFGSFTEALAYDGVDSTFYESDSSNVYVNPWTAYHFTSGKKVMQMGVQEHTDLMDGTPIPCEMFFCWSDNGSVWSMPIHVDTYPTSTGRDFTVDVPRYFNFTGALRT